MSLVFQLRLFIAVAALLLYLMGSHGTSFADSGDYDTDYRRMACAARLALTTTPLSLDDFPSSERRWVYRAALHVLPSSLPVRYRLQVSACTLYEAKRAGIDPVLVLAVIQTESNFRKYCISSAGALGLMQIMPFWQKEIGLPRHNLFDIRQNLRFGCMILRHYIDREDGNIVKALARYNGSYLSKRYPSKVLRRFDSLTKFICSPSKPS